MTDFEDRIRRMVRETMEELGQNPTKISDVIEPPGADYCVVTFSDSKIETLQISKPLGAGDSQEKDEIREALEHRFS